MSSSEVDFFRKYARDYDEDANTDPNYFMIGDSLAWCLDRALDDVLHRRGEDCVCLARFRALANSLSLEYLVDASDVEACVRVLLRGYRFLSYIEMNEAELDESAKRFFDRAIRAATVECAACCFSNGVEIPAEIIDLEKWVDSNRSFIFTDWLWGGDSFPRKHEAPVAVIDWFRENAPELFEAAFEDACDRLYVSVASKFEGIVELMLDSVPIREGDPLLTSYDPPLFPCGRRAAKFMTQTLNLNSVIKAMGQCEPFACELVILKSDDGTIHINKNSSFMMSDLVDTDFGLVIVEAVKAGFLPLQACDWEAGEEYVSRLASALRAGIPFEDLVAGEERPRISVRMHRLDL